jgi:hypothetical protein
VLLPASQLSSKHKMEKEKEKEKKCFCGETFLTDAGT